MTADRRQSRHAAITEELRGRIVSGGWPPGHQLPVETEMAEAFGVSRMTMNKVLTRLAQEGFLIRRKKRGTFVAQPRTQSAVVEIADIEEEVGSLGQEHRFELLAQEERGLSEDEAAMLEAPEGQRVLRLEGLHRAGGRPFCLETRLIHPERAPGVLRQDFSAQSPGGWLLHTIPWSRAQHRIRAVNADAALARKLALEPGEACLEIVRLTRIEGDWVTWVRLSYPGHAHQLVAEFEPRPAEG
ncbi:UTRA domain-containing protein [Mangrovicoccus sp. HB161399]|uniref:UTRA domain-containing protein n=1 Tax=Mangrovicoccus sp. HB161399 TaxID=2720392 RepID=UPI001553E1E0|nr:UTRA domain-containing protein [Mangrovicoccus sp. HB161399]